MLLHKAAVYLLRVLVTLLALVVGREHGEGPAVVGAHVQILLEPLLRLGMVPHLVVAHRAVLVVGDVGGVYGADLLEALLRPVVVAAADVVLAHQVQGLDILRVILEDLVYLLVGGRELVARQQDMRVLPEHVHVARGKLLVGLHRLKGLKDLAVGLIRVRKPGEGLRVFRLQAQGLVVL